MVVLASEQPAPQAAASRGDDAGVASLLLSRLPAPVVRGVDWDALVEAFEQNDKVQTLLGIDEGTAVLDLSREEVEPDLLKILGAELRLARNTAALTSLSLSGNAITGSKDEGSKDHRGKWVPDWKYDLDLSVD